MPASPVKLVDRRIRVGCMKPVRTVARKLIVTLMRSTPSITRVLTIGLSFWMAVVACVVGCMQPVFASVAINDQVLSKKNSVNRAHATVTHDMDCRHHESRSGPANDDKSLPNDSVSCCPLDARVTATQKLDPALSASAFENDAIPSLEFRFAFAAFSRHLTLEQAVWHSGRDTLLKAHVLRI